MTDKAHWTFVADRLAIGGVLVYSKDTSSFGLRLNVAAELSEYCGDMVVDSSFDDGAMDEFTSGAIEQAARLVVKAHRAQSSVLVTCAEGRNRSAVVAARSMMLLWGMDAATAIQQVKDARNAYFRETQHTSHDCVLTNKDFVRWLLSR